jgi:hypothetical protein
MIQTLVRNIKILSILILIAMAEFIAKLDEKVPLSSNQAVSREISVTSY